LNSRPNSLREYQNGTPLKQLTDKKGMAWKDASIRRRHFEKTAKTEQYRGGICLAQ
jgi:hypothetical protein